MRKHSKIKMMKSNGEVLWELDNVEIPDEGKWSEQALKIAIDKYFTKENFEKHKSVNYLIERTVESIIKDTYLENSYNGRPYKDALIGALKRQDVVFNSPVWFNFYPGNKEPVGSACFILGLEDDLDDILDKDRLEGVIYSEGSGAGLNYSKLRGKGAPLSGGGKASGPLSFMYKNDATGAIIRSGGKLRRAAKMCVLNDDHPDIMDFVKIKKREEDKAKALIEWDKQNGGKKGWGEGYLESEAYKTVAHQNANHSVGIHDDFMNSYLNDEIYELTCPNTGEIIKKIRAKELMEEIAKSAWECGDPGLFFLDTINSKNVFGEIRSSNPCLAGDTPILVDNQIKQIKELDGTQGQVKHKDGWAKAKFFKTGVKDVYRVMAENGEYIDTTKDHLWKTSKGWVEAIDLKEVIYKGKSIKVKSIEYLGKQDVYDFTILDNKEPSAIINGFELHNCGEFVFLDNSACNLGAIKVSNFVKDGKFDKESLSYAVNIMIEAMDVIVDKTNYPSEAIRKNSVKYRPLGLGVTDLAGALMKMGVPYNTKEGRKVVEELIKFIDNKAWEVSHGLAQRQGTEITKEQVTGMKEAGVIPQHIETVRNAQVTLMAPNGTTSFLVDASTTGIEPLAFLSQRKRMVGGSEFVWIPDCVKDGLEKLGYDSKKGLEFIQENGTLKGFVDDDDLDVFKTAQEITPMEHIEMMATIQKHISGAISKTINLPNSVTVEEIQYYYVEAWKRRLKGITVYRSGSKSFEPLKSSKDNKIKDVEKTEGTEEFSPLKGKRRRMPDTRNSVTHKFEVAGHQGYVTVGFFDDGKVGEMFIKMAKEGSTLSGFMDSMAMVMSIGLQYGIPLEVYTKKMKYSKFEPSGMTSNGDIPMVDSLVDYIARWLEFISDSKNRKKDKKVFENSKNIEYDPVDKSLVDLEDARVCSYCNAMMYRKGTCFYCENCGTSSGCS